MNRAAPDPDIGDDDFGAFLRRAARQEQFLNLLDREAAFDLFMRACATRALGTEMLTLAEALGRRLAVSIAAPVDAPLFDRANVDGVAARAADLKGARDGAAVRLRLNREVLAAGRPSRIAVAAGTGTLVATGGMLPRGADCVVMVEHTEPVEGATTPALDVLRPAAPGQHVSFAGSDIARGETILRRGALLGAREIGMLAAVGVARVEARRRPRVAVLSTGDELVAPGQAIAPGQVYDSNGAILAAAVAEHGGEPLRLGVVADDPAALTAAFSDALASADLVVLSGGTSKGVGDLSHRVLADLPGVVILAHGVSLKPGKPLCLAHANGRAIAVLPGFPTSAMFTFHVFVAPLIRALAGATPSEMKRLQARLGQALPSELGRSEFAMVALTRQGDGLAALPLAKGSGAVTAFSRADGFVEIAKLSDGLEAGQNVAVTLIDAAAAAPDLVIVGSHCVGLDAVLERMANRRVRVVAVGSLGGLAALRRGECDLAPIHLLDPASGQYNAPFLPPGAILAPGWRRMQGVVFRPHDARFAGRTVAAAMAEAIADPACVMVNRNPGAGTRVLIESLLGGARPAGFDNQPRSHNAVAAAVAQGRADWGLAIDAVAKAYGLGFIALAEEHYDFAVAGDRREQPAVRAFLAALEAPETATALAALGFRRGA